MFDDHSSKISNSRRLALWHAITTMTMFVFKLAFPTRATSSVILCHAQCAPML